MCDMMIDEHTMGGQTQQEGQYFDYSEPLRMAETNKLGQSEDQNIIKTDSQSTTMSSPQEELQGEAIHNFSNWMLPLCGRVLQSCIL
jgi:hypothetical protein